MLSLHQTALYYCGRPLLYWGWIACISRKASCTEPRGTEPWQFRTEYMHRATPNIYIYIYIYWWEKRFLICTVRLWNQDATYVRFVPVSQITAKIRRLCHALSSQHPTRALATSPRPVACLRCLIGTPQMRMTRGCRRGCFCLNPVADCQRQYICRGSARAISGRWSCGVFRWLPLGLLIFKSLI